jgi:hypothetical protein
MTRASSRSGGCLGARERPRKTCSSSGGADWRRLIHLLTQLRDMPMASRLIGSGSTLDVGARTTVNCRERRSTMLAWRDTPFTESKTFPEEKCTVLFVRLSTMSGSRLVDDVGKPYTPHDDAHGAFMTLPPYA